MSRGALTTMWLLLVLGQPPDASGQASSRIGIAECDRYAEMVRACLPKMCEEERALREMELGFSLEAIATLVKLKGPEAAARSCAQDIANELQDDEYGCSGESAAGRGALIRQLQVRPGDTTVTISFAAAQQAATSVEVAIAASMMGDPDAVYRIESNGGRFLLDTAVAVPAKSAEAAPSGAPIRLEPGTTYCYAIGAPGEGLQNVLRKGTFTTAQRRP